MDEHLAGERIGVAAGAAAAILFGTAYVATAFVERSFSPLATALWRGGLAAILTGVVLAVARGRLGMPPRNGPAVRRLLVLGLLGGPAFIVGMSVAVALSGAAIASFVAGLYAVLAAVLAPPLLREPLGKAPIAGFAVALVGTLLLAEIATRGGSIEGIGAGLGAALAYALFLVLSRRWSAPYDLAGPVVVLATFGCVAVVLLPVELVREPAAILPSAPRADALLALGWVVVLSGIVAQLLVLASVRRIPARRSSAFLLLNPPSATLAAWLLLGEALGPWQIAGGALVLIGIATAAGVFHLDRRVLARPTSRAG